MPKIAFQNMSFVLQNKQNDIKNSDDQLLTNAIARSPLAANFFFLSGGFIYIFFVVVLLFVVVLSIFFLFSQLACHILRMGLREEGDMSNNNCKNSVNVAFFALKLDTIRKNAYYQT